MVFLCSELITSFASNQSTQYNVNGASLSSELLTQHLVQDVWLYLSYFKKKITLKWHKNKSSAILSRQKVYHQHSRTERIFWWESRAGKNATELNHGVILSSEVVEPRQRVSCDSPRWLHQSPASRSLLWATAFHKYSPLKIEACGQRSRCSRWPGAVMKDTKCLLAHGRFIISIF